VSSRYPQLLCVFALFSPWWRAQSRRIPSRIDACPSLVRVNNTPMRGHAGSIRPAARALHDFKTTAPIAAWR
jgi:hypothetical protein